MFRRRPGTLPKDERFPTDFESLGYFINEKDEIRQKKHPELKYQFLVNKSDRINDVYKDAMNACVRKEVRERLSNLGLSSLRLPLGATESEPHVPVWVSSDIGSKKRAIVLFGERNVEAGIFSYRVTGDEGVEIGSAVSFVKAILHGPEASFQVPDKDLPGIVIANPGQLYWYRGGKRAVSWYEWQALPRQSAVHEAFRCDEVKNKIPGNGDYDEHVRYVFDNVLNRMLREDVQLDIIGLEKTGSVALEYLADNWTQWSGRVSAICLGDPQHKIDDLANNHAPQSFIDFLSKRCRAYLVASQPAETAMEGKEAYGTNCYASGEELYQENIIVRCYGSMLDWFNLIHTLPDYEEPTFAPEDESSGLPN